MNPSADTPSDRFLRYGRQKLIALLAVTLLVGTGGLAMVLASGEPAERWVTNVALVLVLVALLVMVQFAIRGRRWSPEAPAVQVALRDEWLRSNIDRASRGALAVVLLAQFPLAIFFGYRMELSQPQGPIVMAAATFMIGLSSQIGLFLWFDRE